MNRGDVVVVPFPFQDKPGERIRPALVVQSNTENQRLANTILAMITGNLQDAGQPTAVLVDPKTAEPCCRQASIAVASLVRGGRC
jgi:mRNA-degrading endonuclease toxin of MazEF toxin-antitoxin module